MKVIYTTSLENYLDHQMYMVSKSKLVRRKRLLAKYIFTISYLTLGLWLYLKGNVRTGIIFAALGVLWFFVYPILNKNSMRRFYGKYIRENYSNKLDKTVEMNIEKGFVFVNDSTSESKIPVSEFKKMIEINSAFFLRLKSGTSYIIPKDAIDTAAFKSEISGLQIPITVETDWKWQ